MDSLKPNTDAMYDGLSFWFKECYRGQLEIGWRDPATQKLNRFKRFELDEIEELVTFAADVNAQPGANMYFRVCTLKDMAGPTTDEHFWMAPGAHVDHDDAASVARLKSHPLKMKPAFLIITGREPSVRAQSFWPISEATTSESLMRQFNKNLAHHFAGDPAVVNPTRLMRMPGSIAWPVKPGRTKAEVTELLWPSDKRPSRYPLHAMIDYTKEIGPQPTLTEAPAQADDWQEPAIPAAPNTQEQAPQDTWQPPVRQNAPVSQLIDATKQEGTWHNSVLRLVASWVNRGLSDKEIHLMAPALTRPGYTVRQTHEELQKMLDGARQKWDLPDRDPFADAAPPAPQGDIWIDDGDDLEGIPLRPWLVPGLVLRGAVTLLSGQGAGGKSSFVVGLTTSMSGGVQYGKITPTKALVGINYNVEDDRDEQRRRYAAFLQGSQHIEKDVLKRVLRVGPEGIGTLFTRDPDTGEVKPTKAMEKLRQLVTERGVEYLSVDPLAELHNAEENDNTAMRSILAAFRTFAQETGCGVIVLHHDRKGVGLAGDVDRMRGASALQGAARIVLTLTRMTEDEANALQVPPQDRASYIRIDNAKANYTPLGEVMWYKLTGQTISNGESVAACLPWTPPDILASLTHMMKIEILRQMMEAGPEKCRAHHHSQDYVMKWLPGRIMADRALIQGFIEACLLDGTITLDKEVYDPAARKPRPAYVVDRDKFLGLQQQMRPGASFDDAF